MPKYRSTVALIVEVTVRADDEIDAYEKIPGAAVRGLEFGHGVNLVEVDLDYTDAMAEEV